MAALVAVEDLPVKGRNGFRMGVDASYEIMRGLQIRGRTGMAARTTENVGYNAGLGFTYSF